MQRGMHFGSDRYVKRIRQGCVQMIIDNEKISKYGTTESETIPTDSCVDYGP